jgi:hypothetical protein
MRQEAATVSSVAPPVRIPFTSECHQWIARRISQLLSVTAVVPIPGSTLDVAFIIMGVAALSFG